MAKKNCEYCRNATAHFYAPYGGIFSGPLAGLSFSCKPCAKKQAIERYMEIGYGRADATARVNRLEILTTDVIRERRREEIRLDNEREARKVDDMLLNLTDEEFNRIIGR